jgi:signal transduction histidine kinase
VNLSALVEDVLEPFALLAREEGRELDWHDDSAQEVETVPWILRQLLHNLLSNALKHGQGRIAVSLHADSAVPCIKIVNTVKGKSTSGTGIGLRIVEALTRANPALRVESRLLGNDYQASILIS